MKWRRKKSGDTSYVSKRSLARLGCTYRGAILKQDHGNLGLALIEHYKFCHGSTDIFDSVRMILGLDIWFIAYLIQIFIFTQLNQIQEINWSAI